MIPNTYVIWVLVVIAFAVLVWLTVKQHKIIMKQNLAVKDMDTYLNQVDYYQRLAKANENAAANQKQKYEALKGEYQKLERARANDRANARRNPRQRKKVAVVSSPTE